MSLPVSIPLSDSISVLKVSVPLDLISYKVSIPLSAITETPVKSLATLRSRVKLTEALPPGWLDVNELEGLRDHLTFCKLSCNSTSGNPQVGFSVRVCEDFTWTVLVGGRQLQPSNCAMLIDLPRSLVTVSDVVEALERINTLKVCPGNGDEKFSSLRNFRKGVFTTVNEGISIRSS